MNKFLIILLCAGAAFGAGMTLDDCIKTAEKNNLDIRISETGKMISSHSLTDARNRFWDITGSGSYFINGDDEENLNSNLSASAGLEARLSPYLLHSYKSSKISSETASKDYENTLSGIRYTVIRSFFQVLIAEEKLKLQTDVSEYSGKKFEEAELKFNMGNISRSDLLSFEVSRSSDIIDLKAAESSLRKAKQSLIYYMNAPIMPDSLKISYEQTDPDAADANDENALIEEALNSRPDLAVQRNFLKQRELSLKMEYDNYLPSLTGSISYNYNKYEDFNNDLFSSTTDGIKARAGISVNLTYSGLNGIDRNKVEVTKSRLQLENKIESVKNEIRQKLIELENQKNNLLLAGKYVELAQENMDLADKLFFIGNKSATDYLQARNDYIKAKYQKINSYFNFILAKHDLYNSLGRKM
jgi:outer membrane protein